MKTIHKLDQCRAVKAKTMLLPPFTAEQLESFQQLKDALSFEQFLIYDNLHVPLMIAIDTSYKFGFGVIVYQVPSNIMTKKGITAERVCKGKYDRKIDYIVIFLFKELSPAETSYWPIELKTFTLVFAVKKTCHLIEVNDFPTIIHTDHILV
jgi:hypothetical protein